MFETRDADNHAVQKYYGKYPGVVKKNAAPENGNHRGELEVEVSGILEDGSGKNEQRSIVVVAKPCFPPGFFFVPEVGAHVWVEFAAGDINVPIWTGVWYPTDKSPKTTKGEFPKKGEKVIRSAPDGHTIELNNEDGSIRVQDTHGNVILLDQSGITLEAKAIVLKVKDSTPSIKLTLDSSGITATDGSGTPRLLVLDPLLTWLATHQHLGYMGFVANLFPASSAQFKAQEPQMKSG